MKQFQFVAAAALVATMFVAGTPAMAAHESHEERTEARIADMHVKLGITSSEEDQWQKVAAVMRENAKEMDALTDERMHKSPDMDAVDDLESYSQIAEAHADGIRKLTPVFAALYDGMSEDQRDEADELFRHGPKEHEHHHHKMP